MRRSVDTVSTSTFQHNDRVEALWPEDGKWYPARVLKVNANNFFRIRFDGYVEQYDYQAHQMRIPERSHARGGGGAISAKQAAIAEAPISRQLESSQSNHQESVLPLRFDGHSEKPNIPAASSCTLMTTALGCSAQANHATSTSEFPSFPVEPKAGEYYNNNRGIVFFISFACRTVPPIMPETQALVVPDLRSAQRSLRERGKTSKRELLCFERTPKQQFRP